MNDSQTGLYWREWALARAWYLSTGMTPKKADEKRHELHARALGGPRSSKEFTNADLDKVLAAFRAIHDGGNLDAQLAAEDQPDLRRQALVANVRKLAEGVVSRAGSERAYLDGLARNIFKAGGGYQGLTEYQLQQLRGILFKRLAQIRRQAGVSDQKANPNPF